MGQPETTAAAGTLEAREDGNWLRLQEASLDLGTALSFLHVPRAGGIGFFVGTTRQFTEVGGQIQETARLDYEAYRPMALTELQRLTEKARDQWPSLERLTIFHRLGTVPVAEASVAVGAAAPHRAEAFAAARFLIDTLKEQVPIWKRETFSDGETEWVEGDALPEPVEHE
jgi:molybdopterin synthase catalytic subunit